MVAYVDVSQFVRALRDQKAKYHAKVVKGTAVDVNFTRILDVGPLLQLNVWLRIPEIAWVALGFSILYDLAPIVFEPIQVDFEVRLPTIKFDIPRDVLIDVCSRPPEEAVSLLPSEARDEIARALAPGMRLEDAIRIMCGMYPPEVIITQPDIVTVELPNWSAFYHGVYLLINKYDILREFPWLASVDDLIRENFEVEIKRPRKCIYGESRYGECYYDPPLWQEMIKGAVLKLAAKLLHNMTIKAAYEALSKAVDVDLEIVKHLYNRIAMIAEAQAQTFILGYSLLGVSPLAQRGSDKARIQIVDYDGNVLDVHFDNLAQLQIGFILGVTPLGHGVLLPPEDPFKRRSVTLSGVHATQGGPPINDLVVYKARKMITHAVYTPLAFANYQRPDERADWRRSERADQFMEIGMLYNMIDNMIDPILERHGVNVFDKRVYKNAVRQLIGYKAKRHEWGYDVYRAMDENTFKRWWIDYWKAQGLNEVILEELYNTVAQWLERLRQVKYRLGASLRLKRLRLANLA